MKILVLEDNSLERQRIIAELVDRRGHEVKFVKTESDFVQMIDDGKVAEFSVIILDVMIPWAIPAPELPPVDDPRVSTEGFYFGGIRCAERLIKAKIPGEIWFRTIVDSAELESKLNDRLPGFAALRGAIRIIQKSEDLAVLADMLKNSSSKQ